MVNQVLFDANVWYSRTLTDWFFKLFLSRADPDLPIFYPQWTEDILSEAHYNLRRSKPHAPSAAIDARFDRIRVGLKDFRITDYEIANTSHPDIHDHHVINAALSGNSQYLVTADQEFSDELLGQLPFEILTPDEMLLLIFDAAPESCLSVARSEHDYWSRKVESGEVQSFNLPNSLKNAGCPNFAEKVRLLVTRDSF